METRTLLSNAAAPIMGPPPAASLARLASETTWNLQVQPGAGGAGAMSTLSPAIGAAGASIDATPVQGLYVVHGPPAAMAALGDRLAATPGVAYAAPQRILSIAAAPNDPNYTNGSQWQLNGTWGIKAPGAWNVTVGSNRVIVADIDTGLKYNLADMNNNVWLNQAEIPASVKPNLTDVNRDGFITFSDLNNAVNQGPGKIVDTNKDGSITGADVIASTSAGGWARGSTQDGATGNPDDLIGWNYAAAGSNGITGTNNPADDNGHGTFTAGEIAAVGNNALGVTGVEWNAQLMPVKFLDKTGNGTDTAAAAAIHYAVDHGAKVINASWGDSGTDTVIQDALRYAGQHGVIVVCAAGNSGTNDDNANTFFAPASYSVQDPNVIGVAATSSSGALASWSNYGVKSVQLAAPGVGVYGLTSSGGDGTMSGTSMAAPLVTGTLALVWSAHPTWSMSQVIDAVLDHTTPDPSLAGKVKTGGIVNATAAVANTDGAYVVSASPTGTIPSNPGLHSIQVTFNEEINPATFTTARAALTGPNGRTIAITSVAPVAGSNDHTFTISFASQTAPGAYTLKVGPDIQDWYGNNMNQNRNGVNGEVPGDQYLDVVTIASGSTNTLFTTQAPANPSSYGGGAVELGVKFESSVAGHITGIRFYKGTGNTGTHIGYLWSGTGTLLASGTFGNETAGGWQQMNFATPVAIAANTLYVASYYSPTGYFAYSNNYFTTALTNGPLTAPASGSVGGNGVYAYTTSPGGAFPTQTYQSRNYWVDVVLSPQATTYSLWSNNPTPQTADASDGRSAELGVRFTPAVSGTITGVRFYKGALNTGTHVADLWTASGTLLASATFSGETGSGWQQVSFSRPVAVTAGTTYVASYHTNVGQYAVNHNDFTTAYVSGPLQVPANRGVYAYGAAGTFPRNAYQGSNYWVDIVLAPTSSASVSGSVQPGAVGLGSAGPVGTVPPAAGSGASTGFATLAPSSISSVSTTGPAVGQGAQALAIGALEFGDDTIGPTAGSRLADRRHPVPLSPATRQRILRK